MHICFITSEFPRQGFPHGGVGTFVATLGKALVEQGIQVSVIGLNYINKEETENIEGINVYRVVTKKQKGLQWYFNSRAIANKIKEVHQQNNIDIVETAELGLAFLPKIKKIKYVIRLHGGHHFFAEGENRGINPWKGFQEKRSFSKADGFIAVSEYVKSHTAKYLSYNDKLVQTIPLPIDFSKFYPADSTKVEPKSIVFAGTVCEKKGIRQLIMSMTYIKEKFPEAILHVYGRDWLFPDKSSYIAYLKKNLSLKDLENVIFHGAVSHDELPEIYEKAEVCAFPSHMETQGLVAPEAMSMEKPVLFTALGPGPETIINYETGLLADPHNPMDIAKKIIYFFSNPEKANEMGKKAREFVLKKFNSSAIVEQNIEFYNHIIKIK
jgi:glycosyltransferase involved in cell wall biosynthesis